MLKGVNCFEIDYSGVVQEGVGVNSYTVEDRIGSDLLFI